MNCPNEDVIVALVDEPESATDEVKAHVKACTRCRAVEEQVATMFSDLRVPVSGAVVDRHLDRLDRALAPPRVARPWRAMLTFGGALALAAGFFVLLRHPSGDSGTFAPRGLGVEAGAARDVGLALHVVGKGAPMRIDESAPTKVPRTSRLLVSYATRSAKAPFHLLCFGVDGKRSIHWLYPAYESAATDPGSVVLPPGEELVPMATEVILDDLEVGPLHVFAVVATEPMHVSDVERLAAPELSQEGLRRRFAGADVRTWDLEIAQ